jgi:hypothetical protein
LVVDDGLLFLVLLLKQLCQVVGAVSDRVLRFGFLGHFVVVIQVYFCLLDVLELEVTFG